MRLWDGDTYQHLCVREGREGREEKNETEALISRTIVPNWDTASRL